VQAFDRARGLESSFEGAWNDTVREAGHDNMTGVFGDDFRKHWTAQGDAPALLLNTTLVQNGSRVIVAPFQLFDYSNFRDVDIDMLNGASSPRLSAAVSTSARFPVVTPPASYFQASENRLYLLADGGYHENSGIKTAIDLIRKLQQEFPTPLGHEALGDLTPNRCAMSNLAVVNTKKHGAIDVCFKAITIRTKNTTPEFHSVGELYSPILAMLQARVARGRSDERLLDGLFCGGKHCGWGLEAINPHIYVKFLQSEGLPLGWYLSNATLTKIFSFAERRGECPKMTPAEVQALTRFEDHIHFVEEASCIYHRISQDLAGSG
jgi:hypothetical protein